MQVIDDNDTTTEREVKKGIWRDKRTGHLVYLEDIGQVCADNKLYAVVKKLTEHNFPGEYMFSRTRLRIWANFQRRFEFVEYLEPKVRLEGQDGYVPPDPKG